jgi:transposase
LPQVKLRPEVEILLTISGIGKILGLTIMLEVSDIRRFAKAGNYASYCRCVKSQKISETKKKGGKATAKTATAIYPGPMWMR